MTVTKRKQKTRWIWVRVGDGGEYQQFDGLDDAVEYLNESNVGKVDFWISSGIATVNYRRHNYVSLYWGDSDANMISLLLPEDRAYVEDRLEESYL